MGLPMPKNAFKDNPLTEEYETKAKNILKAEFEKGGALPTPYWLKAERQDRGSRDRAEHCQ